MKGSEFRYIGNITLGCISQEARELLDTVMEEWEKHRQGMSENLQGFQAQDPVYSFAYWLIRWSGLIEPAGYRTQPKVTRFETVLESVRAETISAMKAHDPMSSCHEGYAVILEELDELWEEVKRKRENRDSARLRSEAVQVAAMAVRFIVDLGLERGVHSDRRD